MRKCIAICHFSQYYYFIFHIQHQSQWDTVIIDSLALAMRPCQLVLAPAMLSSFPVAWKLKGCTQRALNCRSISSGASRLPERLSAQVDQLQGDLMEAKQNSDRTAFLGALWSAGRFFFFFFLLSGTCWETHHEKERKSGKDVSVCVWMIETRMCFCCCCDIQHFFPFQKRATVFRFHCRFLNVISAGRKHCVVATKTGRKTNLGVSVP